MSLLLDALKRAEQEKLARSPADVPPPARERAPPPLPPGSLELQPLSSMPAGAAFGGPKPDTHSAQAVFQAKSGASAGEPRSRGMVWATVGAIAVVVIAAGAYVWYSLNSLTPKQATYAVRPRPAPIAPVAAGSPPPLPTPEQAMAAPPQSAPGLPVGIPAPAATLAVTAPAPAVAARQPRPQSTEEAVAQVLRESPPSSAPPLRLDRTAQAPRQIPADISAGYDALRRGDLPAARRGYGAAMAVDPANLDAQLGLATVESRSGNRTTAAMHYRKALELDPRNSTALAGLAALSDFSRPDTIEARLRAELASNPESGPLHFTLGNVYSAQGRWNEAQLEFFEAHRLDPGSPDVMFNLAVSLDNLGQTKLAAGFYSRALEAARAQAAQFDPALAARRLAEIR